MIKDYKKLSVDISNWIKDYSNKSSIKTLVVGVSGGVDSAVVSTLCAMTGMPLILVEMPIHQNKEQVDLGKSHISNLKSRFSNVKSLEYDLTNVYEEFKKIDEIQLSDKEQYEFTLSNTRSRLRMTTLYNVAGQTNGLVVGTGNKIEDFGIKFFTKYGDGGVDISPIGDLLKSEVFKLGEEINVIEGILNAKPTDGLHDDGRTDEDQIGASYDELEAVMAFETPGMSYFNHKSKLQEHDRFEEVMTIYNTMNKLGEHKMNMPPIYEVKRFLNY